MVVLKKMVISIFKEIEKEVSVAFHYRIYDEKLAMKIQEIVKCINSKKWNEVEAVEKEYSI